MYSVHVTVCLFPLPVSTTVEVSTNLAFLCVSGSLTPQEDGEGGSLGPLGDVDDLLQSRYPESDVLGRYSGIVEGV